MAIIWMVIFHTSYDLKIFQFNNIDFSHGFWFAFPRIIAWTFLFCVGLSLWPTHHVKTNWQSLKQRSLKLALGAISISIATYFIFPNEWIFFGTLHCILFASIIGAILAPHKKLTIITLFTVLIFQYLTPYDIKWVSQTINKPSMDFIPIYPWIWPVLLGMILSPVITKQNLTITLPRWVTFLSRHSLAIYLLHQPIIYGLIMCIKALL